MRVCAQLAMPTRLQMAAVQVALLRPLAHMPRGKGGKGVVSVPGFRGPALGLSFEALPKSWSAEGHSGHRQQS